ncbi:cellulose biosynthesis protein BcsP [Melaminivora alkalimesophila]|uniref:cellulose biosynthesis protein BcsP n=1 Tax=Melaminivora alkalimesophila TaxID=1165852 RepID=UPI0034E09760
MVHLFREFGGRPQSYQELGRARKVEQARERWPLLSRLQDSPTDAQVPPVRQGAEPLAAPAPGWSRHGPGEVAAPAHAPVSADGHAAAPSSLAEAFAALRPTAAQARLRTVSSAITDTPVAEPPPRNALAAAFASLAAQSAASASAQASSEPQVTVPRPSGAAWTSSRKEPRLDRGQQAPLRPGPASLDGSSPLARLAAGATTASEPNAPPSGLRHFLARLTGRVNP